MKDSAKQVSKESPSASRPLTRWTSLALLLSALLAYYLSANAYGDPYHNFPVSINFAWQNWGAIFIVLELILAYLLKRQQGGMYWFFWLQLKTTNPDERQKTVRQRIFERAYGFALIVMLFTALHLGVLAEYDSDARGVLITRTIWIVGIFLVSLPSILAAWQKDS